MARKERGDMGHAKRAFPLRTPAVLRPLRERRGQTSATGRYALQTPRPVPHEYLRRFPRTLSASLLASLIISVFAGLLGASDRCQTVNEIIFTVFSIEEVKIRGVGSQYQKVNEFSSRYYFNNGAKDAGVGSNCQTVNVLSHKYYLNSEAEYPRGWFSLRDSECDS